MITISGNIIDPTPMMDRFPPASIERKIIQQLSSSQRMYDYDSPDQLHFELALRNQIILASRELNRSRLAFTTFRDSRCNPEFWIRTEEGGFRLRPNVEPARAIQDIYNNSSEYGTECATAIVILYYKAVLSIYPANLFNRLFANIYLMNWMHVDSDLGIRNYQNPGDYLPGDCRYFKNPDVNPLTPYWQGENAIDLGDGTFYGHGIGISDAEGIIRALNNNRIRGSVESAYLMDTATRPDFKYLANRYGDSFP